MPLPRKKTTWTAEQQAAVDSYEATKRANMLACAPSDARQWIDAGCIGEVKSALRRAVNNGDAELAAIYEAAIKEASE